MPDAGLLTKEPLAWFVLVLVAVIGVLWVALNKSRSATDAAKDAHLETAKSVSALSADLKTVTQAAVESNRMMADLITQLSVIVRERGKM